MYSLDLASYFKRIGYTGQSVPTLSTLQELHLLHPQAIVFENLDVLFKRPIRLNLETLAHKLVEQGRGGYCYEQNTLFEAVLKTIGFSVSSVGAKVQWRYPQNSNRPRSHMVLRLRLPDADYIADVGFGRLTLTAPLRLETGVEQMTPHGKYRLIEIGSEIRLEAKSSEGWLPVYQFSLREESPADWEVYNWYTSTHPDSRFTTELMVARPAKNVRYGLLNNVLSTYHMDGRSERQTITTANELDKTLRDQFGIDFPKEERRLMDLLLQNTG